MHGGGRGVCAQIGPWRPQRRSTLLYLLLLLLVQIAAPSSDTLEDIDGYVHTADNYHKLKGPLRQPLGAEVVDGDVSGKIGRSNNSSDEINHVQGERVDGVALAQNARNVGSLLHVDKVKEIVDLMKGSDENVRRSDGLNIKVEAARGEVHHENQGTRLFAGANDEEDGRPLNPDTGDIDWKGEAHDTHQLDTRGSRTLKYKSNEIKKKKGFATAPSRPNLSNKKEVEWLEEYHGYSLKASVDDRFRIRHAPIPTSGAPWPMPQLYRVQRSVYLFRYDLVEFHAQGESCDILDFQFERIQKNAFGEDSDGRWRAQYAKYHSAQTQWRQIWQVNVTVLKECDSYPHLHMDESYDLEVKRTGVSIIAREVWGAVRGLETFSQLVYQDHKGRYLMNKTFINDYPRFKHRGILLDTARHFLDKSVVMDNLEAMAQNKMNVFHWHIVDDQSFPYESKVYPNLTKHGAYDAETHLYTQNDIADIIEAARLRGIRVIPEFDTPGHTYSWGYGRDHLLTPCYNYKRQPDGFYGPVNPILKSTYRFLKVLFAEILGVFPEKYVHLGGDEVPFDCWTSNPFINHFMKRNNLTDVRDLLSLYERKLLDIIDEIGAHRPIGSGSIVWQEVFDNGVKLKPGSIVQIWMGDTWDIDRVTSAGYQALYSTCWYLDYINYGQDWDKYYKCDQIGTQMDEFGMKNESLLLGGEACVWTEYADDDSVMPRLWPRASGAAERLWSSRKVNDIQEAAPRIEEHRCRMIKRGLRVGVLSGPGHCSNPDKRKRPLASSGGTSSAAVWPEKGPYDAWPKQKAYKYDQATGERNTVYVVDMNAMYVVPLILLVCVVCLTMLSAIQDNSKNKLVAILTYPVAATSKRGVRGLLYVFLVFAVVWCIWTAPIWMNAWEKTTS